MARCIAAFFDVFRWVPHLNSVTCVLRSSVFFGGASSIQSSSCKSNTHILVQESLNWGSGINIKCEFAMNDGWYLWNHSVIQVPSHCGLDIA